MRNGPMQVFSIKNRLMAYEYIADDKADDFQSLMALKELILCMRGNFSMHFRCGLLIFFKINFFKKSFKRFRSEILSVTLILSEI